MAKLPTKLLPLVGVVLLLSLIGFFLLKSDRGRSVEPVNDETAPSEDIGIEGFETELTRSDSGKETRWILRADRAYPKEGEEEIYLLENFSVEFKSKEGLDFELEGRGGEFNSATHEIILSGELKGKTGSGYMLYSEYLEIQVRENSIRSHERVSMVGPLFKITGRGLYIDLAKETLKILEDVNSIFNKESLTI